jgi:hypothetical protein
MTETILIRREMMAIPGWAIALAVAIFVLCPVFFLSFVFRGGSDAPMAFRLLVSFLPGTILAFLALMVGYVNRDAGLRGMSRTLWTLIVIFVPNAIGFILYFLLRNPINAVCPQCGANVDPRSNYCRNCGHSLHPTCPQCRSAVRTGDTFCATCGAPLRATAAN